MAGDLIIGGGGGGVGGGKGGGGTVAGVNVAKDSLDSIQYARVVDLISEGEIDGFPSARAYARGTAEYNRALLKDIYFNNTAIVRSEANPEIPYQASDFNFKDVTISVRYGTQDQTYLQEIGLNTQEERQVNVKVIKSTPITRSITDPNVNGARVTISLPALQVFKDNGDVTGAEVQLQIQLSYNGGPFTTVITDTIKGRTADLYQRRYRLTFTQAPPVDIRVVRVTDDPGLIGGATTVSEIFWASYTELISAKTTYPNSAVVGLLVSAEQFSSIPNRAYLVRGIKVAIPSNATVDANNGRLIYSGVWNGTFQAAKWCADPAWILWDLLTSKRYGFGDHITADSLDKWSFYAASQYCSTLVPDGFGGQEPRFSCNVNIQTQEEAFKLVNDLCSVFRAQSYWSTGSLTIAQDRPTDPSYLFNQANVTEEGFAYSGSSLKTRHTVAVVAYLDLEQRDINYEVVEDAAGMEKYGVVRADVSAFACTSRGQARRIGEWLLYSEQNETEVVSFKTGIAEAMQVRPGMIIRVYDPVRGGLNRAGRIIRATAVELILDRTASEIFPPGLPPLMNVSVILPDGSLQAISNVPGTNIVGNRLLLPESLRDSPVPGAPWLIGIPALRPTLWRVLSLQEDEPEVYSVTAVSHDPSKYDYIERDQPLIKRDTSQLDREPDTPGNLQVSEVLYEAKGAVLSKLVASWAAARFAARYELRYRVDNGNWLTISTRSPAAELLNTTVGRYEFELAAISAGFKRSGITTLIYDALGKTAPPEPIPDLFIAPIDEHSAELYWPQSVDLDVRVGGEIRIRHTPVIGVEARWGVANDIVPAVAGSSTRKIVPLLEGTYLIRAVDSSGNEAPSAPRVVVDLPEPQDTFLIQTYREDDDSPPFQGAKTSMFYSAEEGGLALLAAGQIDEIPDWDAVGAIDFYGATSATGSYQFLSTLDLSQVYDIDLLAILRTRAFQPGASIDERTELIDIWEDIDGDDLSAVNAGLQVRTTTDNPGGTPTWSSWQPFVNGTTRGRAFQFRAQVTTDDPSQNLLIEQLGVTTRLQRRTETQRNLSSGTSAYTVTFPAAFYATPSIGITAQDLGGQEYFTLSNATRTGFQITFRDSGGSIISRTFDYLAVGHGREIT